MPFFQFQINKESNEKEVLDRKKVCVAMYFKNLETQNNCCNNLQERAGKKGF